MSALSKRRRELRSELTQIEKQIYDLESNYLEETKDFGNIFTGWNAYASHDKVKQRKTILTEDRLFSLSSVTSPAARREEFKKSGKAADASAKAKARRAQKKKEGSEAKVDGATDAAEFEESADSIHDEKN